MGNATIWIQVGLLIFYVGLVAVSVASAVISYYSFRVVIDPHVIVYVKPNPLFLEEFLLIAENIGKGLARDVTFSSDTPLFVRARKGESRSIVGAKPLDYGPFKDGIPALAPGQSRSVCLGDHAGIRNTLDVPVAYITCKFYGDHPWPKRRTYHEVTCPLEVESFEGVQAQPFKPDGIRSVEAIDKLRDEVTNLAVSIRNKR